VEPYGGGASVLLRKPRSYAEVYNDLDGEIVNLFTVLRDRGEELCQKVALTPFARAEFDLSYQPVGEPVEQARRTLVRTAAGYGGNAFSPTKAARPERTGFSCRRESSPARDWGGGGEVECARRLLVRAFMGHGTAGASANGAGFKTQDGSTKRIEKQWPGVAENMADVVARLQGIVIECRRASQVMLSHDSSETLHYVDPPYVPETRDKGSDYRHEMTPDDHREMANVLHKLKGMVILSGYDCRLYKELFGGWKRFDKATHADGARKRMESLWLNPVAVAAMPQAELEFSFEEVG
jgi:DNA adenine methylase